MSVPLPLWYRAVPPELSSSASGSVARTGASNLTCMSISAPVPYVPLAVAGAVTLATDAADRRNNWKASL